LSSSDYGARLDVIQAAIAAACQRAGRAPEEVTLVCVSKTVPAESIRAAHEAGAAVFGENYGQDLRDKARELADLSLSWHFIGPLQRNKVRYVVGTAHLIHTIHSADVLEAVDARAHREQLERPVELLVQLNLSGEATKSGASEDELEPLLDRLADCRCCRCIGLMTMPPFFDEPERARPLFARLRELRDRHAGSGRENVELTHLSMGMSGDFEVAIEEGATLVRVGTALFGARS
jgi:pyridoxal phosphate enzyme (YggS family)